MTQPSRCSDICQMFTFASRAWHFVVSLISLRMNRVMPVLPLTTGAGGGGRVTVYFTIT